MRLLSVGSLPPEWGGPERGGVATFHASLLEGLRRTGNGVELVGVVSPSALDPGAPVPVFERPDGVTIARFYEELLGRLRPDVVLMNHVAHTIGATHAQLADPPPAIGVVHSWHNITFADPGEVDMRREVTQQALDGLAAMVVGSRHCLEEGERLGLRYPAIARSIHYPLQPLYIEPGIDLYAAEREGVLFLGSLTPRKNPEALVAAAARLPGLTLTLAGEGELKGSLREAVSGQGLDERVRLSGHFPLAEHLPRIRSLLLGAQAMCLPSRSESFGLAFIEALACGTPVIGFGPTVREIRDAMGIEIGEPLDRGTPEEIAVAIEQVLGTVWNRDQLRRAALEAFGLAPLTERYVELLIEIAREHAGERAGA